MNVTIAFGSRVAIPVRALPFVTALMTTPTDIARGLAEQDDKSEFVAYWAEGGEEIAPQEWRPIRAAIEGLTTQFLDNGDCAEEDRQIGIKESISHLPAGAFVWADTFKHWLDTECQTEGQVRREQHSGTVEYNGTALLLAAHGSGYSFDPSPNVPLDIQRLVMKGFEAGEYAEMIAANHIDVDDFLCLVGLDCLVDDGMYNITQGGIRASAEKWDLYAPGIRLENRKEIKAFIEAARLDFPCTPQRLVEWANGVNWDFQLPIRFVRAVAERGLSAVHAKSAPDEEEEPADHSQQLQMESLVAWHQSMVLHWPGIKKKYSKNGKMPTARQITTYLTDFDTDGCVVPGPDKKHLYWHPLTHGPKDEPKRVAMKTVLHVRAALMEKGLLQL